MVGSKGEWLVDSDDSNGYFFLVCLGMDQVLCMVVIESVAGAALGRSKGFPTERISSTNMFHTHLF